MKPHFYLMAIFLSTITSVGAQENNLEKASAPESGLSSMVSTYSIPLQQNEKAKAVLCISSKWEDEDFVIGSLLQKLANEEKRAIVYAASKHNCFDQAKISDSGKETVVTILNRINKLSDSQISVPVEVAELEEEEGIQAKLAGVQAINSPHSSPVLEVDTLRNSDKPLLNKVLRGTAYIQGAQVLGLGILMVMPPEITNWESPVSPQASKNFKDAWTKAPVWDKDNLAINFIGHPLSGAGYYNAIRSQGASPLASFVFSTAQSLVWEYGFEAINERPSIQDLLFTSTIGSIMGEAAHRATLRMTRNGLNTTEKILVTIINPMFVVNNGYKKKNLK